MFDWKEVLDFWFGDLDEHGLPDGFHRNRWFKASRSFDQEIRYRFMSLVLFASEQGLTHWRSKSGGALAEIIMLDQFTRQIHRGGALAFSNDKLAVRLAKDAMRKGQDLELRSIERAFMYMPLQHSENKEDQALSVECYQQLCASTPGIAGDLMESFLQSARDHRAIVERFGRFPHRNDALKRKSSADERAYLQSGKRFGQ